MDLITARFKNRSFEHVLKNDIGLLHPDDPYLTFPLEKITSKLMLINFDQTSDPTGSRRMLIEKSCDNSNTSAWASFTECLLKGPGTSQYRSSLADIYERNMKYPFWLSPRGMGIDCHRTWEAIYLGRIPIVLTSELDPLYEELPVLILDDWNQINEEFLRKSYNDIMDKRKRREYNYDKLKMSYWRNIVLKKTAYWNTKRPARCWHQELP
jgi:hypothetical protein